MSKNSKKRSTQTILLPLIILIIGMLVTFMGVIGQKSVATLQQNGVIVDSLDIEGNTDVIINGSHTVREIAPKFATNAGDIQTCRAKVDEEMIAELAQKSMVKNPIVQIRYLPNKPSVCEVVGAKPHKTTTPLILGVLMMLGAVVAFIIGQKR